MNAEYKFRIDYQARGGVAGIDHRIIIDARHLTFRDNKKDLSLEKDLSQDELKRIKQLAGQLREVQLKPRYGSNLVSDCMTTALDINSSSVNALVEVITDPNDLPPLQFWKLTGYLVALATKHG